MFGDRDGDFERRDLENLVALEEGVRLLCFRWLLLRLLPLDTLLFFDLSLESPLALSLTTFSAAAKGLAAIWVGGGRALEAASAFLVMALALLASTLA